MTLDCTQGERLGTIESALVRLTEHYETSNRKLDQITDLLVSNARIEEKLGDIKNIVRDHEVRLRDLEQASSKNSYFSNGLARFLWIVGGAIVTLLFVNLPKVLPK
jgi:hypothetical protein